MFSFEGRGSGSHYVEASFWRRLWTCRQTEYWMNEWMNEMGWDGRAWTRSLWLGIGIIGGLLWVRYLTIRYLTIKSYKILFAISSSFSRSVLSWNWLVVWLVKRSLHQPDTWILISQLYVKKGTYVLHIIANTYLSLLSLMTLFQMLFWVALIEVRVWGVIKTYLKISVLKNCIISTNFVWNIFVGILVFKVLHIGPRWRLFVVVLYLVCGIAELDGGFMQLAAKYMTLHFADFSFRR